MLMLVDKERKRFWSREKNAGNQASAKQNEVVQHVCAQ
jgi:hypothetical protein